MFINAYGILMGMCRIVGGVALRGVFPVGLSVG
jgi:hypothetical protein